MTRPLYYVLDGDGEPVGTDDAREYARLFESIDRRRVARDEVGGYTVSTVFLGFDPGSRSLREPNAAPAFWETIVFWSDRGEALYRDHYDSSAAAREGHARAVEAVRRGEIPGRETED
jgi:hypothetical protein